VKLRNWTALATGKLRASRGKAWQIGHQCSGWRHGRFFRNLLKPRLYEMPLSVTGSSAKKDCLQAAGIRRLTAKNTHPGVPCCRSVRVSYFWGMQRSPRR